MGISARGNSFATCEVVSAKGHVKQEASLQAYPRQAKIRVRNSYFLLTFGLRLNEAESLRYI